MSFTCGSQLETDRIGGNPAAIRLRTTAMTTVAINSLEPATWALRTGRLNRAWGQQPITVAHSRADQMHQDPSKTELAGLLSRTAGNDAEAFSRLYDLTSELVYGVALRVIKSSEMAEEVTQEVFIQVWEQASSFDAEKGSARAWIATIAHRRAVDVVRRSQSSRDREEKVLPDLPADDVAGKAIEADEHSRLREALSSLTDLQFEAIEMAYFGGLTYREVAERLDAPLGTVKSRMRDGLMRLREAMGGEHG